MLADHVRQQGGHVPPRARRRPAQVVGVDPADERVGVVEGEPVQGAEVVRHPVNQSQLCDGCKMVIDWPA
jgi:hypothetical protein